MILGFAFGLVLYSNATGRVNVLEAAEEHNARVVASSVAIDGYPDSPDNSNTGAHLYQHGRH